MQELGPVVEPASFWNRIASSSEYSVSHRRHAVFQLFSRHVKPPITLGELSKRMDGARWLKDEEIQQMGFLSGTWPESFEYPGSVFRLFVLYNARGTNWCIALKVSEDIETEDFIRLVRGKPVEERVRSARITAIRLSSPGKGK
jgi:hypothetical protein